MNQKTSFLDLSQVYGASEEDLANLIATDKMHLKTRSGTLLFTIPQPLLILRRTIARPLNPPTGA